MRASRKSTTLTASPKATPVFDLVDPNRDARRERVEFARW
jgi:hypothetical protein